MLFTPSNIKKQIQIMKSMTAVELTIEFAKLIARFFIFSGSTTFNITRIVLKFILRLMTGEPIAPLPEEEEGDLLQL